MKKWCSMAAITTVCLAALCLTAAGKTPSTTRTGWISDSGCGAKGASADHKKCAVACVRDKGGKWVFVDSGSKKVYSIHNQDAVAEDNVGKEVKVTGMAQDDGSIHVESIAPAGGM
jgi:maltose-binding protein MalE